MTSEFPINLHRGYQAILRSHVVHLQYLLLQLIYLLQIVEEKLAIQTMLIDQVSFAHALEYSRLCIQLHNDLVVELHYLKIHIQELL